MAGLVIALPLLALASQADPSNQSHFALHPDHRCTSFPTSISSPSLAVIEATYYPAGATVDLANGQASVNTTELPAFCRLVLNITTNTETGKQAGAEVWLPDAEAWNGRAFGFGLGAWGGGGEFFSAFRLRL
jgi:feruloyl esterase